MRDVKTKQFAIALLEEGARLLEADAAIGRANLMIARGIGTLALLLDLASAARLVNDILATSTVEQHFGGCLTNIALPNEVPTALRELPTLDEVVRQYPMWTLSQNRQFVEIVAREDEFVRLAAEGRFDEAWKAAGGDGVRALRTAVTQAIFGDAIGALHRINSLPNEEADLRGGRLVCAIELARIGQLDACQEIVESLIGLKCDAARQWDLLSLSRGIAGYEPWGGYPYSDD